METFTTCFFPHHYSEVLWYSDKDKAVKFDDMINAITDKKYNYSGMAVNDNNKYQFQRIIDVLELPFKIHGICSFCGYYEIEFPQ